MSKRNIKNHGKRKPHGKQVSLTPDKGTNVQRKHKDTLFRFIFRDGKKLLQLYNALNQSDYENVEDLRIVTLENVVYLGYKNLAVEACFAQGILTDVLKGHRKEVVAMFLEDYDEELYRKMVRKEGYDDGAAQGRERIRILCECLVKDNRQEEVIRAMTDFEFQELLMKEYGI